MSKPASNPFFENNFSKLFGEFKVPQLNMEAMMNVQRKNVEALTALNQATAENMQALMRRQADWMRQCYEEGMQTMNAIISTGTPEEKMIRQAEASKAAVDKCMANAREIADTLNKCNSQAMETVSARLSETITELRDIMKPANNREAA